MNYKIFFSAFIFLIFGKHHNIAQCFWDSNKGIKTNLGSTINVFDWRMPEYSVYTGILGAETTIKSPFNSNNNPNYNIQAFINQQVKDYEPNDGWELLVKNFGTPPNDPYRFPTLALYNRFESLIRVFIHVPTIDVFSKNTAKVEIFFTYPNSSERKESALLMPLALDKFGLDKFPKKTIANVAQQATYLTGGFWMYADFPVAYDPCSCLHFTEIDIRPVFINVEKVDLKTSVLSNVLSGGAGASAFGNFSLPFEYFAKGIEAGNKRGMAVGKTVESTAKFFNDYVLPGFDTQDFYSLNDGFGPYLNISKSFRIPEIVGKSFGYVGIFLGIADFLFSNGKNTSIGASSINYRITGTISDSTIGQNTKIYVPGSLWAGNPFGAAVKSKPIYDNTLGVFALVSSPKFRRFQKDDSFDGLQTFMLALDPSFELKYVVNPASNLEVVNLSTQIVSSILVNPGHFATPSSLEVYPSMNVVPVKENETRREQGYIMSTPPMSIECLKNCVAQFRFERSQILGSRPRLQLNVTLRNKTTGKLSFLTTQYRSSEIITESNRIPISEISKIPIKVDLPSLTLVSDITLRAWERIKISGNINTNGFKLTLISGGAIDINPSALNSNIEMRIENPANCGDATPMPMDANSLKTFCTSTSYDPKAPLSLVSNDDEERGKILTRNKQKGISVNPNPFTHQLTLDYEVGEESTATIELSNALGQTIKRISKGKLDKGNYQEVIETSDLSSGIYFLSLRTDKGVEIKKVIKQ